MPLDFLNTKTRLFKYNENLTTKKWKFSDKKYDIFHTSAQNIDCGYSLEPPLWGGSNEYPQSMFLSKNKKNNVYPSKPQFYYIKVGFKRVSIMPYVNSKDNDQAMYLHRLVILAGNEGPDLFFAAQSDLGFIFPDIW